MEFRCLFGQLDEVKEKFIFAFVYATFFFFLVNRPIWVAVTSDIEFTGQSQRRHLGPLLRLCCRNCRQLLNNLNK